ncbi:T9SS type A sorting domain-containing protein [Polaribacter sp. PL03]|uniref:T9SS type A sorting domain-containing protein n=1 Tax=Polaribacter sp. PL03 TaxID=3088353 RepID=UPI0029D059F0|nr:T9SS type A sorting domain-containing protein [Polaribacter sp. PL03]MDX6747908.1 T9SS type A sorting domain-containing protein [Polaribacter sp. PL03]
MIKKLQKKRFLTLALLVLLSFQMNAQYRFEFNDAATGTDRWNTTTRLTSIQNKNSVTYTTTLGNNPTIQILDLALDTGAPANDQTYVQTARSRRLMAITIKNSNTAGPTYLRVSWIKPSNTSQNFFVNQVITAGDTEFKTYLIDLAAYGGFGTGQTNNPRAEWNGIRNDIRLQFKTDNSSGNGINYNFVGAEIEIEKIEFLNNHFTNASLSNDNWGNPNNWLFAVPGTEEITSGNFLAEDVFIGGDIVNANLNVNVSAAQVKSISLGNGAKLNNDTPVNIGTDNIYFGFKSSFNVNSGSNVSGVAAASYKIDVPDTNWHMISAPVIGEKYDDAWVAANNIASGTLNATNKGIGRYVNTAPNSTTGHWRYFQGGAAEETFNVGAGYSIKRSTKGIIEFKGTGIRGGVNFTTGISQGGTNGTDWNLIGSQYTSYLNSATFLTDNNATLPAANKALYVWDASSSSYTSLTVGNLLPGQAFFIKTNGVGSTAIFNSEANNLDVGNSSVFYRAVTPKVTLSITSGRKTLKSYISYVGGKTASLDPGFDIGLFSGVSSNLSIYTHLLENNEGISLERQALPNTNLESMVIPVGVKAPANKEIIFSAEVSNLPSGIKVFLEDKQEKTFTRIDEVNQKYKVTLTEKLDGVGRFYLHTSTKSTLSINKGELEGVSLFKSNKATLKIVGLQKGKASLLLFNIKGQKILSSSFDANGLKEISLPKLATGVYLVKLITESGKLNKKIILE